MALSDKATAGAALFIGGVEFSIIWIVSETLYPNYSVMSNYISDLGTTCPGGGGACYVPPAWWLFNSSEVVFGLLILVAAYFLHRAYGYRPLTSMIAVTGAALVCVGVFNESWAPLHSIFSLITFLAAGLSAIISFRFQRAPLSYLSALLGVVSLVALLLYIPDGGGFGTTIGVGPGGLERLIVYPVLLWAMGFGGHLIGQSATDS